MKFRGDKREEYNILSVPLLKNSRWQKKEAAFLGLESPDHLTQTTHIVDTLYHKKGSTNIMFLWLAMKPTAAVPLEFCELF